jgi:hypothetical protein
MSTWRRGTFHQHRNAATAGLWKGETSPLQLLELQAYYGGDAQKEVPENTQDYNGKGIPYKTHYSKCVLHGGA